MSSKCRYCIVCRNNKENLNIGSRANNTLFQFPSSPERRQSWLRNLSLNEDQLKSKSRVCELHFSRSQLVRDRLRKAAIPSIISPVTASFVTAESNKKNEPGNRRCL
ncbi:unnamed protein product [Orchesella dallaii]|uniref:THAP-type domain-containing protein n=1 Tax=Orchesella dallaii TaxID=48710 RepID=A0ABP1S156_9HEXA